MKKHNAVLCVFLTTSLMLSTAYAEERADKDGDLMPDSWEVQFGTNPDKSDTDGDGISDIIEIEPHLMFSDRAQYKRYISPLKFDTDGNGVSDAQEDTDKDGLINADELKYSSNIFDSDSDGDKLSDSDEVRKYKTNPTKTDTDGDTVSDYYEIYFNLNPLLPSTDGEIYDSQRTFNQTVYSKDDGLSVAAKSKAIMQNSFTIQEDVAIKQRLSEKYQIYSPVYDIVHNSDIKIAYIKFSLNEPIPGDAAIFYVKNAKSASPQLIPTSTVDVSFADKTMGTNVFMNTIDGTSNVYVIASVSSYNASAPSDQKAIIKRNEIVPNALGIKVFINGHSMKSDVLPVIKNSRTFVPIRAISSSLGGQITWNDEERKVTIINKNDRIILQIGSNQALVNNKHVQMDAAPFISSDRTLVPLRFIAENLNLNVNWIEAERKVSITSSHSE